MALQFLRPFLQFPLLKPSQAKKKNETLKKQLIQKIVSALDTLSLAATTKPSTRYQKQLPNNAYFMNFRRYQAKQDIFWEEYRNRFNGDLKKYIKYQSEKYPFL